MSESGPEAVAQRADTAGRSRSRPSGASRTSSRLANDAWESLLTAHAALMKQFAAEDVWHGLTMREYDVLYTLSKCPEPIRPAELNRHVLLTQPALSRMVDRLIERGFVQRTRDPHDGRGVRLSLTADGRARQRRVGGRHAVGVARALTGALTDDELRALEQICGKLADTTNRKQP
ncbi:MarR family winged helix-turn-helix transcriptional regulator [Nocardia carnea]|uniref:MarR family winged helix-turn-helix transcriptional regulator n=1 Tax=Nocardia carnea TaxID=37328 RepID=UPI002457270F|nr:MarR family transcriptional regulator [Nocardia carnea]